jgi:transcriptional/translational regulatory protein YebC/TACO1
MVFDKGKVKEEVLMNAVLDAGAEDIQETDKEFDVIAPSEFHETVREAVKKANLECNFAEITMVPQNTVKMEGREAEKMLKLMEALEDADDVQRVYANFDIPDSVLEQLGGS